MKRKVPGTSIRKAVKKSHPHLRFGKNADMMIYLNCVLFLKALAAEATLEAQSSKQRSIQETHVTAVAQRVLDQFKG
eukprot:m.223694 g.223694  ORF g.223694 m.223694 type:complete len:77 (-) comp25855_c0_seq1:1571-1801(-)